MKYYIWPDGYVSQESELDVALVGRSDDFFTVDTDDKKWRTIVRKHFNYDQGREVIADIEEYEGWPSPRWADCPADCWASDYCEDCYMNREP